MERIDEALLETTGQSAKIDGKEYTVGDYVVTNDNFYYPGNVCVITGIWQFNGDSSISVHPVCGSFEQPEATANIYEINEATLVTMMHKKTKRLHKTFVRDEITGKIYDITTGKTISEKELNRNFITVYDALPPSENVITIDGPAGAGKSTMAKLIADMLNKHYLCVDTGAFYRALAVAIMKRCGGSIPRDWLEDSKDMRINATYDNAKHIQVMFVNNVELSEEELRNPQISQIASKISTEPDVRRIVNKAIREYAKGRRAILEGRDTGSVIMPDAKVKFFLTADVEVRAKRRCEQTRNDDYEAVLANIKERDERDSTRQHDPLIVPRNAIYIDSSQLNIEQTASVMTNIAKHLLN